MNGYVAVTDNDWFRFLRNKPELEEVNFWQPSGSGSFRALTPGQPFFFKLHWPENYIVGGGFFAHFSLLPSRLAWDTFGEKNGAATCEAMRGRLEKYRKVPPSDREEYIIGCILLAHPFFFDREHWIPAPSDFKKNIVRGKGYDLSTGLGRELWETVQQRLQAMHSPTGVADDNAVYGDPVLVRQRLGQGTFRVMVTDAYQRRCAVTGEKVLPVLQAAHILPVSSGGTHRVDNGLLLRSDIHTLFDGGYVTVSSGYQFQVSRRLHDDFDNGEEYCQLQGSKLLLPRTAEDRPRHEFLEWHRDTVFLK